MYRPFASVASSSSAFLDVESTIRGLTQDLCLAFNTGNYDQWAACFAPDGQMMAPNREPAHGPKSVERLLRELRESGYQDLRLETLHVDYSGDMAVETGRYNVAIRQANGTTVAQRGKYVHAWRRLGAWLILADCWNSNLPLGS